MILYNLKDSKTCQDVIYYTFWMIVICAMWVVTVLLVVVFYLPDPSTYFHTNVPNLPPSNSPRSISIGFSLWLDFIVSFAAQLFPLRGLLFNSFKKKKKRKKKYGTVHICRCCCSWRTWPWRQKQSWNGRMKFWMCWPAPLTEPPCK